MIKATKTKSKKNTVNSENKEVKTKPVKTVLKEKTKDSQPVKKLTPEPVQKYFLHAVQWEESEAGWGTRGDGWTFHKNPEDALLFIKEYWDRQPKATPSEYTRNLHDNAIILEVSEKLHEYVMRKGNVWLHPNNSEAYKTFDTSVLKP